MIEKVVQLAPGFISSQRSVCPDCQGEGEKHDNLKISREKKTIDVPIEQGAPNDHYVRFSGDGNEVPGVHPGDLIVVYKTEKHALFERKGADLIIKKKVSLYEALTGVAFQIKHLDGKKIDISTMKGEVITPGMRLQLQGLGMPFHKDAMSHGNLYVDFDVEFPKRGEIKNPEELKKILPVPKNLPNIDTKKAEILTEFDPSGANPKAEGGGARKGKGYTSGHHHDDDDYEDEDDMPRGQRVQCNQQ
mmetsp:Transcript_1409/g.1287  ORF Transcript_1409/g.1287 Transcript_1409/m.1287 type:complete len:247 (+) Transcript_1409:606-1346(+)